jgi:hypothetical protein
MYPLGTRLWRLLRQYQSTGKPKIESARVDFVTKNLEDFLSTASSSCWSFEPRQISSVQVRHLKQSTPHLVQIAKLGAAATILGRCRPLKARAQGSVCIQKSDHLKLYGTKP